MELWLVRHGESTWNFTRVDVPEGRVLALDEIGHLARTSAKAVAP